MLLKECNLIEDILSPYFITNADKMTTELENPLSCCMKKN